MFAGKPVQSNIYEFYNPLLSHIHALISYLHVHVYCFFSLWVPTICLIQIVYPSCVWDGTGFSADTYIYFAPFWLRLFVI